MGIRLSPQHRLKNGMRVIKKLVIDVRVHDLDRAVLFYKDTLGLNCSRIEKEWAAIKISGAELHLYLNGGVSRGVEFYVDNIDDAVTDLKTKGVKFFSDENQADLIKIDANGIAQFPWGRNASFYDSEGNRLALIDDF